MSGARWTVVDNWPGVPGGPGWAGGTRGPSWPGVALGSDRTSGPGGARVALGSCRAVLADDAHAGKVGAIGERNDVNASRRTI